MQIDYICYRLLVKPRVQKKKSREKAQKESKLGVVNVGVCHLVHPRTNLKKKSQSSSSGPSGSEGSRGLPTLSVSTSLELGD